MMVLVALLGAMGCDDDAVPRAETVEPPAPEPTSGAYEIVEFEDGGSVAGHVRWTGERPEIAGLPVRMHADACGEDQPSPALSISERGRVRYAVVSLTDVRRGRAWPEEDTPVEVSREGCRITPHVVARMTGLPIRFSNRDAVMHNLRARLGGRSVLDVGLPEGGAAVTRTLREPGALRVVCDVGHTWELGWIHVFEHPYFAVTDENGGFRIDDVPPGRYTIRVWHEGWRAVGGESGRPVYSSPVVLTRTVSILPREETRLRFELSQQAAELAGD